MEKSMEIYTDGGCIKNPGGLGSWAFVVVRDGVELHHACGTDPETTNNRMELLAVIEAVKYAAKCGARDPRIYTDSQLTVLCGRGTWKRKKNTDLWAVFQSWADLVRPTLLWVKGHAGNQWNERADRLCTQAMREHSAALNFSHKLSALVLPST